MLEEVTLSDSREKTPFSSKGESMPRFSQLFLFSSYINMSRALQPLPSGGGDRRALPTTAC